MTCKGSSLWLGVVGFFGCVGAVEAAEPATSLADRLIAVPTAAVAMGSSWPLSPAGGQGLAVDATVGAALGWPRLIPGALGEQALQSTLWVLPEFGYSYRHGNSNDNDPRESGHLGSVGVGVGYGNLLFAAVAYTPRLVIGSVGDELAVGLRHGVSGHFLGRVFSAELSHQMLSVGGELRHELRVVFGLNLGALLTGWH